MRKKGGFNGRQGTPPGSDGTECRFEKGVGGVEKGGQVIEGEGEGRDRWRSTKTPYIDTTTVTSEGSTPAYPCEGKDGSFESGMGRCEDPGLSRGR